MHYKEICTRIGVSTETYKISPRPPQAKPFGNTLGLAPGVCQDSCACTRFLCMHNTLVHAQHSCACTAEAMNQAWDPKRQRSRPLDRPSCFFGSQAWSLAPGLVPGPWVPWPSACTRVLCMHKSVAHAQESCACTRILDLFM